MNQNGEPWFVAKDVVAAMGKMWNDRAISHVPAEWKGMRSVLTPGGKQDVVTLSEPGLYFYVNRSDSAIAIPFQKWVSGEVLPQIRKTGGYVPTPEIS
ncbi:MAG: Bro-N domain-containing protein [Syntrophobacteraceae bacterium]